MYINVHNAEKQTYMQSPAVKEWVYIALNVILGFVGHRIKK